MRTLIMHLVVPTDSELRDEDNYRRNWQAYCLRFIDCPHCKLSRKVQAEFLSVALAFIDHRSITYSDGRPYHLPEFDEVFKESKDYRAFSDYTRADDSGLRYDSQPRDVERLRFFWILMSVYDDIHGDIDLGYIHGLLNEAACGASHISL